jgi:hypothetical protein
VAKYIAEERRLIMADTPKKYRGPAPHIPDDEAVPFERPEYELVRPVPKDAPRYKRPRPAASSVEKSN